MPIDDALENLENAPNINNLSKPIKRKLFINYVSLAKELQDGNLTQYDLDNGLFFLNKLHRDITQPVDNNDDLLKLFGVYFKDDRDKLHHIVYKNRFNEIKNINKTLQSVFEKAEKEYRIKLLGRRRSFRGLNNLLEDNGYDVSNKNSLENAKFGLKATKEYYSDVMDVVY
jgi:hypothetical protein